MKTTDRRVVVLDSNRGRYTTFLTDSVLLCSSAGEIEQTYRDTASGTTWLSWDRPLTDDLLRVAAKSRLGVGRLLTIVPPRPDSIPSLLGLFPLVLGASSRFRWLPREELIELLLSSTPDDDERFLAAAADPMTSTLSLIRGDFRSVVVPFSLFAPSGDGTTPDFSRPRVTDFGQTIELGNYAAAADAILYETDTDYRRKLKRQRQQSEQTFGASLLRLRLQRGIARTDFAPVSAKTIARIERDEIGKPHGKTLTTIAARLGVDPDEIGDY